MTTQREIVHKKLIVHDTTAERTAYSYSNEDVGDVAVDDETGETFLIVRPAVGSAATAADAAVHVCESVAALRATNGSAASSLAFIPGTAVGGFFRWEADTSTPHDGAMCIAKASGRTGAWIRQYNGVIYPEWFGDVDTDATAAIQAAIDYSRPVDGATPIGRRVHLTKRDYPVSSPIKVYSGTQLEGEGPASKLVARATFSGTGLIIAGTASSTTTTEIESFTIRDLGFDPGVIAGLWAIDLSNIADILHATIDGIWFWTAKGLNLSSYLQFSHITRVTSFGSCDQILWAKGNHNTFAHIDKEGGTGSTSDPYILIEEHALGKSQSNNIRHVLIEQTTSVNKTAIKAVGTYDLTLEDVWVEPTLTDGYAVVLDDCKRFTLRGAQTHMTSTYSKWSLQNGSYGQVVDINSDAEDVPWQDVFSIDDTSMLTCPQVYSRRATNIYPIDSGHRVRVATHIASTRVTTPAAGYSAISRARNVPPENLAANGSFEAGDYRWGKWGGAGSYGATQSFPASEVWDGLMCQFDTFTGASQGIVQSRSISAAQVGRPVTLAALVQLTGNGYVSPHFDGAGVTLDTGCQRVQDSDEWHLMTATVIPTSAGSLEFGVAWRSCDAASVLKIDMLSLIFGDEGVPMHDSYQQIERGGNTIVYGVTAAPASGTWKRGDQAWRSDASSGNPPGWVCTAAGSPGTWTAMANLA